MDTASKVYSVSDINRYISSILSHDYNLSDITVCGEITGCKLSPSGHMFFSIKDEKSILSCVMFGSRIGTLSFRPENGTLVNVSGSITVYERDGKYQLYVEKMTKAGMGALFEQVEALKRKLNSEGLFDVNKKKKIPKYIKTLGVVTSRNGAVIHDIRTVAGRRNPYVQIILCPASVQGADAPESIISGIKRLDSMDVDCIIVGRGGGSFEDLMCFNDEGVARAIYECKTPVISAVGHETDFSIADLAADRRAATPSEAAELAVYDIDELFDELSGYHFEMKIKMQNRINKARLLLGTYEAKLAAASPQSKMNEIKSLLLLLDGKIKNAFRSKLETTKYNVRLLETKLTALNPSEKLSLGYSYTEDENGNNIRSVEGLKEGQKIKIHFADGVTEADITKITKTR